MLANHARPCACCCCSLFLGKHSSHFLWPGHCLFKQSCRKPSWDWHWGIFGKSMVRHGRLSQNSSKVTFTMQCGIFLASLNIETSEKLDLRWRSHLGNAEAPQQLINCSGHQAVTCCMPTWRNATMLWYWNNQQHNGPFGTVAGSETNHWMIKCKTRGSWHNGLTTLHSRVAYCYSQIANYA